MEKLLQQVLATITPSETEKKEVQKLADKLIAEIKETKGKHLDAVLAGSSARDTHLKGDKDLDIFVLYPGNMKREEFEKEGLSLGKQVFKNKKFELAYSEHPYVRGEIEGHDVEIIPCYQISDASERISAVDRSPLHNQYLLKKLSEEQKNDIRLLKKFLKGIKAYGAELKTIGVPGYLTELLIANYGNFENTLKGMAEWKEGDVIDIEQYLKKEEARESFKHSFFMVIDPTDRKRNVAAALSRNQFARMIAASRQFLQKPSTKFFFGNTGKSWKSDQVKKQLGKMELLAIQMPFPKNTVPDIVWGQLKRLEKKTSTELTTREFKVARSASWTNEKNECLIVAEVESRVLQKIHQKIGPKVEDRKSSDNFLKVNKKLESGPRISDGRWVIEVQRKFWKIEDVLKDYMKKLKASEKAPLKQAVGKIKIMNEAQILLLYRKDKDFQEFLTEFLIGKEIFLEF